MDYSNQSSANNMSLNLALLKVINPNTAYFNFTSTTSHSNVNIHFRQQEHECQNWKQ